MKIICPLFALFNRSTINCALSTLVAKASLSWADDTSPVCMNPNGLPLYHLPCVHATS